MEPEKSVRQRALEEAIALTTGDRNKAYGSPYPNLKTLAGMVTAYLGGRRTVTAADVAAINILMKLSRISVNPTHHDSWVDAAAYAGIGLECAEAMVADAEKDNA